MHYNFFSQNIWIHKIALIEVGTLVKSQEQFRFNAYLWYCGLLFIARGHVIIDSEHLYKYI